MMRLAATDEMAWRCPLGAASRAQPTLAAALRAATLGEHPAEPFGEQPLVWDVEASALLGAITTAYRRWVTTPSSRTVQLHRGRSGHRATGRRIATPAVTSGRDLAIRPIQH
jgi:hypothetical protein